MAISMNNQVNVDEDVGLVANWALRNAGLRGMPADEYEVNKAERDVRLGKGRRQIRYGCQRRFFVV